MKLIRNYLWILTRTVLFLYCDSFDYVITNVAGFLFQNSAAYMDCLLAKKKLAIWQYFPYGRLIDEKLLLNS